MKTETRRLKRFAAFVAGARAMGARIGPMAPGVRGISAEIRMVREATTTVRLHVTCYRQADAAARLAELRDGVARYRADGYAVCAFADDRLPECVRKDFAAEAAPFSWE